MTLAAPRSRQGRAFLALAFLAAMVAVVGGFLWASQAHADLPTTTLTYTQSPTGPATVNPGTLVTYTITLTTTGTNSSGNVVLTAAVDADLANTAVTCSTPAGGVAWTASGAGTASLVCTSTGATTNINPETMTVTGNVHGNISVPTVTVHDGAGATITAANTGAGVGALTLGAGATVTDATNFPGIAHTFVFTLDPGVTCASDGLGPLDNDLVDCSTTDVTTGGTVPCTASAPTVGDPDIIDSSTVSVTVTPSSGAEGTCTVTLAIKYIGPSEDATTDDFDIPDVTATKTYSAAAAGGVLRHLDLPDAATEDQGPETDPYCGTLPDNTGGVSVTGSSVVAEGVCGIISGQDDVDDATGSFHAACIVWTDLTWSANGSDITWSITPVAGGPTPAAVQGFGGPNDEPCVMWGAGSTGTQQITATYAPGAPSPSVNYYWNEYCVSAGTCTAIDPSDGDALDPPAPPPLPLIKEWNTLDFTKIISVSGDVGDTLADNSGDLENWVDRDCSTNPDVDLGGFCARANLDTTTWDVSGVLFPTPSGSECAPFSGGCISADGASFIDYTMGSHSDAGGSYSGPVDGASQTYSVSGDCGAVRLEDPTTGQVIILTPGQDASVLSSDKGVGFEVVPNADGDILTTADNADCQTDSCVTVDIATEEDNLFHSPPLVTTLDETIDVCFHVGPPTNKQPLLAWAGQRIVLEHDWSFIDQNGVRSCPWAPTSEDSFFVRYLKQSGNGALVSDLGDGAATGPDFMVVQVGGADEDASLTAPNDDCVSRVLYEAQDQGEQDLSANVVECELVGPLGAGTATASAATDQIRQVDPDTCSVVSEQVPFLIYYMKLEDLTLKLLPDETTHLSPDVVSQSSFACDTTGEFASGTTVVATGCAGNGAAGADTTSANVSANVLARVAVRGWVLADNCPARDSGVGENGEFKPANRCIFPDDWRFKAGGDLAESTRPNYDIYDDTSVSPPTCSASVAGPFSQLSGIGCSDSLAPHAPFDDGVRFSNFPDGHINANDAPMPPALIEFILQGSGFLLGTNKHNPNSEFDVTHVPAEPWITPINEDLEGYLWNSWGTGPKSGVYDYWTDFADHSAEVLSCAGASTGLHVGDEDSCPASDNQAPVPTGGYDWTKVYSDEHGIAMTWINGDANLDFGECDTSAPINSPNGVHIVQLNGFYCVSGDKVGSSTLSATADYPDKRKHFAISSNDVTIDWTWGGIKDVTVEPGTTPQFNYVVIHLTDRDGFCANGSGNSPNLHPVLGEEVDFSIDSPTGVISPDVNGNSAEGPIATVDILGKNATTHTFDTSLELDIASGGITVEPVMVDGECQAWIHVTESQLANVNVIVTAFDPEGTVTFDTTDINPTPSPTPVPTDSPTPVPTKELTWGDWNCDGTVNLGDAIAIARTLVSLSVTQGAGCPGMGDVLSISQDGLTQDRVWGDTDCNTTIDLGDAIKIDRALIDLPITTFASCPGLFQVVTTPAS